MYHIPVIGASNHTLWVTTTDKQRPAGPYIHMYMYIHYSLVNKARGNDMRVLLSIERSRNSMLRDFPATFTNIAHVCGPTAWLTLKELRIYDLSRLSVAIAN